MARFRLYVRATLGARSQLSDTKLEQTSDHEPNSLIIDVLDMTVSVRIALELNMECDGKRDFDVFILCRGIFRRVQISGFINANHVIHIYKYCFILSHTKRRHSF